MRRSAPHAPRGARRSRRSRRPRDSTASSKGETRKADARCARWCSTRRTSTREALGPGSAWPSCSSSPPIRARVPQSVADQRALRPVAQRVRDLAPQLRSGVPIDRHDGRRPRESAPASRRHQRIASAGKPAQCFTRRKRSSSAAATSGRPRRGPPPRRRDRRSVPERPDPPLPPSPPAAREC